MSSGGLTLVLIVAAAILNAGAQILLRLGGRSGLNLDHGLSVGVFFDILTRPAILGGLASYGFSIVIWIYVLSRAEASYAYPFLGLGFVLVALAGWLLLGETMTPARILATGLITAGVILLAST